MEGNYWSRYSENDLNMDGLGDTPYVVTDDPATPVELIQYDNYPLMGTFNSFDTSLRRKINIITNSTVESFTYFESNDSIKMHISNMTGIQDPYEEPLDPEILLDTEYGYRKKNVNKIINKLIELNYV